jgi:predicted negative regulator of RcsB-dependent stress response
MTMLHNRSAILVLAALLAVSPVFGQSVTRPTFHALESAQELMNAEQYQKALTELEALAIKTRNNPYDFALTSQYLAHVNVLMDNRPGARAALKSALAYEGLPDDLRTNMNLFYGTVLLGDEEFELALEVLEAWFALAENPQPSQIFSLAYANYQAGNRARAEEFVARSIGESAQPRESWYQLYYRVLYEQKKYDHAEAVMKGIVGNWPANAGNWRMLASHYLQLENSQEGLATMMIAYLNMLLESETDLKQIVSLWGYVEAPERGARLLSELLESGRIESSPEMLKQLGNLWLMARERDNAVGVLGQAAEQSPDGRTYELLGGIHFEEEAWSDAYESYQKAIEQGDLDEPLRVSLLAGISAYRAGRNSDARRALEIAAEDDELRPQAESVLRQLN